MTPAEKLGIQLMALRSQSQLTQGIGGRLVDEALSLETRRRRLDELRRCATSLANAAAIASRDMLRPMASDELVREAIERLQKAIAECQSGMQSCENATATASTAAVRPIDT